jgi:hypothetical protein
MNCGLRVEIMGRKHCDAAADISQSLYGLLSWTTEKFVEFNRQPMGASFVVLDRDCVCGYLSYTFDGDVDLHCLGVKPGYNEHVVLGLLFLKLEHLTHSYPRRRAFVLVVESALPFQVWLRERGWRCIEIEPINANDPNAGSHYVFRFPGVIE